MLPLVSAWYGPNSKDLFPQLDFESKQQSSIRKTPSASLSPASCPPCPPFSIEPSNSLPPSLLFGVCSLLYTNYIYHLDVITFQAFPDPVAKKLRRALYYANIDSNPRKAIEYYKQALTVADEIGMHPFGDEVLGIKISFAAYLEQMHQYRKSIDVLEVIKKECLGWIEARGERPGNAGQRNRVLKKAVGISIKLGELYSGEYIVEPEAAEAALAWAVETALKESRRREKEGVKEDEGPWMNDEENGAAMECM